MSAPAPDATQQQRLNPQRLHPLLVAVLAPLAGALVTLSLAPFTLWPAGIASLVLLSYLLCACTPGDALWRGWLYGLGFFGSGASWVWVSIHDYGFASVPLATLLTALFCAGLALFHSLFGWVYVRWVRPLPGGMLLGFALLWVLFEWLRSWLLTGFPWLYLGYAHLDTWIAGWAPVFGVFGLSLMTALSATCLFLSWRSRQCVAITTYAGLLLLMWLGGAVLKPIEWVAPATEEPLSVAMYQPNIPQAQKWDRAYFDDIVAQYQSVVPSLYGYDIILWPEAAIPTLFQNARGILDPIASRARQVDSTLITGIPMRPTPETIYNSIIALGQGEGVYHKQRLVPFGEYVPLESVLRGLIDFFDLPMSSFSAGSATQPPLRAGSFRIAPYICYEIVYPGLVAAHAREADLLVTISNDSWFGASIGPLQHLQMARMRALENGRYLIRGTNNGVSAIIDHRGQVLTSSEQFVETTLTGEAEVMLGRTPVGSFGTLPIVFASAIALVLMFIMQATFWRPRDPHAD
ncbi:apolipoprotein N-acyltransferase [Parahalioglobus pacificus]|uniref:Apolipoprotein N-acyltransferase n=1 Tax=Parahalioglobus pacificus TaxID=930806 RepID=A0A919CHA4_9GAMM|nr:apolipoprotein N-acyltransferase [Halioglobus pacificus]GHD24996.1 apolipoprotein N-acyltransferase [Halioglobus pacificus]